MVHNKYYIMRNRRTVGRQQIRECTGNNGEPVTPRLDSQKFEGNKMALSENAKQCMASHRL